MDQVPVLEKYKKDVTWHIVHKYSKEMATKSEIVSIVVKASTCHKQCSINSLLYNAGAIGYHSKE